MQHEGEKSGVLCGILGFNVEYFYLFIFFSREES